MRQGQIWGGEEYHKIAILVLTLLAGCQAEVPTEEDEQTPSDTTSDAASNDDAAGAYAGPADGFRPGTWQGEGRN